MSLLKSGDRVIALARGIAVAGGLLSLALAATVVVSVVWQSRAVGGAGVPGEFELVQMLTALSIFSFLPYTQARRGNIIVDTFTGWLPRWAQAAIDAGWDMVYAVAILVIAWQLGQGALDAARSSTNTMVLGLPIAPAIAACAVLSGFTGLVCLLTARRMVRSAP